MRVNCFECALRACGLFKPVSQNELAVINDIKRDHLTLLAGAEIIRAEQDSPELSIRAGRSASKTCRMAAGRF